MIIITILALIIVVAGLVFYFSSSIKLVPPVFIKGVVVTEKGTVIENVISSSAGQPMFLKVKKEGGILSGSEIKVIYHTNNTPCVKDAMSIKAGDNVEIHGVAVADDTVSTCGSSDYYIKSFFALDFFAGGSITGNSFKVNILDKHIDYQEFGPGNTNPVKNIEKSLSLVEFEDILKTIADSNIINLQSQDFEKEPMIPDQGRYLISLTYNGRKSTVQCAIAPPVGTEKNTVECQNRIDALRDKFNAILGVNIY